MTLDANGYKIFVRDYINDVDKILKRFEEVNLTLSIDKSKFGFDQIIIVDHLCKRYGRKSNPEKVNIIARMKAHSSTTKVRRFLEACIFYQIWILHFVYMAKPLYKLLRKGTKFKWEQKQEIAMEGLKEILKSPPILKQVEYDSSRPLIVTVDTSPIAIE